LQPLSRLRDNASHYTVTRIIDGRCSGEIRLARGSFCKILAAPLFVRLHGKMPANVQQQGFKECFR